MGDCIVCRIFAHTACFVAFTNRTFTFQLKTPPTSYMLLKCAGVKQGASKPGHETVGKVHVKHVYEIAKIKQTDEHLKDISLESLARCVAGSARSMGIIIEK
jgi:large subunit ribosomal protein L11